jgi:hypothetical protein
VFLSQYLSYSRRYCGNEDENIDTFSSKDNKMDCMDEDVKLSLDPPSIKYHKKLFNSIEVMNS